MTPIDLSKSLVGELYPLSANSAKIGKFSFEYKYAPGEMGDIGDAHLVFTIPGDQPNYKWRITPLLNSNVLISCTHPLTGKTFLLGCTRMRVHETYACVVESPVPEYCEQVGNKHIFSIRYVEGSPLFIQMKFKSEYVCASGKPDERAIDNKMFPVGIYWGDEVMGRPDIQSECTWYLEIDEKKSGANALNGFTNLKPFDALSQRFAVDINESFLDRLKAK